MTSRGMTGTTTPNAVKVDHTATDTPAKWRTQRSWPRAEAAGRPTLIGMLLL